MINIDEQVSSDADISVSEGRRVRHKGRFGGRLLHLRGRHLFPTALGTDRAPEQGKLLSCFGPLGAQRGRMWQAKKTQDSQLSPR